MEIKKIKQNFSVCKVTDYSLVNLNTEYCFIGKTDEENGDCYGKQYYRRIICIKR